MTHFIYNDTEFSVVPAGHAWDICRKLPGSAADPAPALVASGLFAGLNAEQAAARAQALVRSIYPVGIKVVGPDVNHPNRIGELKIVGPDVAHPNFVYWNEDSTSFPQQR